MNIVKRMHFMAAVAALMLSGVAAWAALLGVAPGVPTTTFSNPGTTSYNASTGLFTVTATPVAEAFGSPIGTKSIATPRGLSIGIQLDSTGALIGGVGGNDLTLTGTIPGTSYSGVLLTGEIAAFGYQNVGTTDVFDFRFHVTGGALAPLYGSNDIGVKLTSENSSFTGSFLTNFSGTAKGTIGAIRPLATNTGVIGDFVWQDTNRDGIQDSGEPGIDGVTMRLLDGGGNVIATTTTGTGPGGQHGYYQFTGLGAGTYTVAVVTSTLPAGFTPTGSLVGADRAIDSNGAASASVTLATNNSSDQTIDFGYQTPGTGLIGDFVWNDLDRDGIQDAGEPGIPNVTVWLKDPTTGAILQTATTDANGAYTFTGLLPGTYVVEVDTSSLPAGVLPSPANQGGNPAADSNGAGPFTVTIGEGEQNRTIDFGFYPPATGAIGDVVWNDLDRDGIQDAGEPGINDVTVQLMDSSMNVIATQVTHAGPLGQNGYYQFTGLTAGTYYVQVLSSTVPPGFVASPTLVGADRAVDSNTQPTQVVLATDSSSDQTLDFGYNLPASGKIGDWVWNDTNRDGIQNDGGTGMDGVTVYLKTIDNVILQTTTTTAGGYYEFDGLKAGDYKVEIVPPGGFSLSPTLQGGDTARDSNVNGGIVTLATDSSQDLTVDFGLNTPASGAIGDRIWNDLDRDGVQDAGEPGLVGITVELVNPSTGVVLQTTTTGVNGIYQFSGLTAGTYEVRVVEGTLPPGFVATGSLLGGDTQLDSNGSPATVTLATDSSTDYSIDFGYQQPASGTIGDLVWHDANMDGIQDTGELGIDGVTLYLYDASHTRIQTQITHDGGQYLFTGLVAGTYTVEIEPSTLPAGYVPSPSGQGGDPTKDSNGLPATVILPDDFTNNVTIDFGYFSQAPAIDIVKLTNGQDADTAPGPYVLPGSTVTWTYVVTNTGDVALSNIVVKDDNGTPSNAGDDFTAWCPKTTLTVGESMTCSAIGSAGMGQYGNVGTVTGQAAGGVSVTDSNPSHYYGAVPSIAIEKFTNGTDGPTLIVGTPITWTYIVTNVGGMPLTNVTVTDNRGVAVTCPKTTLAVAEKMTCTATGTATLGAYTNTGTATGTSPTGGLVNASDDSWYTGTAGPGISITKTASPTQLAPFQPVTYTYEVKNTGGVTLNNVTVKDDNATPGNTADDFTVTCPKMTLAPGESMTCTKTLTPSFTAPPASNVLLGSLNNYTLFALNNGSMSINSATSITGDVGISSGVDTVNAQKVDAFTGTAYVHTSAWTDFSATYAAATFAPSGGIIHNSAGDALLTQANTDAANLKTFLNGLNWGGASTLNGSIDQNLTAAGGTTTLNLYNVTWAYNTNTLTLNGGPNDWFIFRSTATGNTWADSQVILNGVDPNHVLFYFTGSGALDFTVNKATTAFQGTIFAPDGEVIYHNPATFYGRIIAKNVTVHSDFNITQPPGPTPVTLTNIATATGTTGVTTVTATDDATVTIGTTALPPPPGTIGNFVWNDLNANGIQDAGEPGLAGVTVVLNNSGGTTLQTTTTDSNGLYQFTGLTAGTYTVQVAAPTGYSPSPSLQGGDTAWDSNGSPATVTLPTNSSSDMTIDFGFYALAPAITINKLTNGSDGASFLVGSPVVWTYDVKNTGNVPLSSVSVTDSRGVAVTCPKNTLAVGEVMQCTASGTAVSGPYSNTGTATGTPPAGSPVTASDGSSYTGVMPPGISITKTADPTSAYPGQSVTYTYTVTNTGGLTLNNISVTDDNSTPTNTADDFLVGTIASLAPGASATLTKTLVPLRDTISEVLGGAGPSSGFAVLSLGGDASHTTAGIKCSNAVIKGNIGVVSYGAFNWMGACSVAPGTTTTFYRGTNVTDNWTGPEVTNETYMNQLRQDAFNASTYFAGLTPTQTVPGNAISLNGTSLTLTGVAGMNVLNITTLGVRSGATLTLTGPPGTQWVINVSSSFYLDNAAIALGSNLTTADVIWNLPGTTSSAPTFGTHGPNTFKGIVLAPYTGGTVFDLGPADGMFIGGYNELVTLMSGTPVTAPTAPPPTVVNTVKATVTVNGSTLTATATATVTLNK